MLGEGEVERDEVGVGAEDGVEGTVENRRKESKRRKVRTKNRSRLLSRESPMLEQEMDGDVERRRGQRRTPSCRLSCPPNRRPPLRGITTDTKNCRLPVLLPSLDNLRTDASTWENPERSILAMPIFPTIPLTDFPLPLCPSLASLRLLSILCARRCRQRSRLSKQRQRRPSFDFPEVRLLPSQLRFLLLSLPPP